MSETLILYLNKISLFNLIDTQWLCLEKLSLYIVLKISYQLSSSLSIHTSIVFKRSFRVKHTKLCPAVYLNSWIELKPSFRNILQLIILGVFVALSNSWKRGTPTVTDFSDWPALWTIIPAHLDICF